MRSSDTSYDFASHAVWPEGEEKKLSARRLEQICISSTGELNSNRSRKLLSHVNSYNSCTTRKGKFNLSTGELQDEKFNAAEKWCYENFTK
ncbi:hypothetical protein AVEN_168269-1 [Araneus ventricosus]|uniref:Uncharacterized protein n=1 Tax=Araneus ventricosus TaxID=182803 RepID=A0A4Y2FV61_ARAVE|nr:hypothetical protein AVEN_168269-1 [Araneus ventricosus]